MTELQGNDNENEAFHDTESDDTTDYWLEGPKKRPLPSGMSALIRAATEQLGHLVDLEETSSKYWGRGRSTRSGTDSDDGASSDGRDLRGHSITTPTMESEPDPSRQTFPEIMMTLAMDSRNTNTIAFLPDGRFFAIRVQNFMDDFLLQYFSVATFEEFLDLMHEWGFSRVVQNESEFTIEVFRHPMFREGDWQACSAIKFGESPTNVRLSALPTSSRARFDFSLEEAQAPPLSNSKRRLSPGHMRRGSETSATSVQKRRLSIETSFSQGSAITRDQDSNDGASYANSRSDDIRSVALAWTTEKLNLRPESVFDQVHPSQTLLVDQALKSATQTIVSEAIETLLNDEFHTKETFRKHASELSKSSLPGVVPISKQLFEPDEDDEDPPTEVTTEKAGSPVSLPNTIEDSPRKVSPKLSPRVTRRASRERAASNSAT